MKTISAGIIASLILFANGCTHLQLRKNASQQLRSTSALHQQQVMDNVAKVSANAAAWPDFARISEGLTQLTDDGQSNIGLRWNARTIFEEALGLSARRALTESWKNVPITEAPRLRAMWAVYHYSAYGHIPEVPGYDPDLQLSQIFGPNWQQMIPPPGWFYVEERHESECSEKFYCGCVVGRHCDTRAFVCPGSEGSLNQLTFLIMELATVQYATGFPTGNPGLLIPSSDATAAANQEIPIPQRLPLLEGGSPTISPAFTP